MAMDENDERLIEQFLAPGRQDVPDDGFTRRVMRHLPYRGPRWAWVWNVACLALAVVLFVTFDGLHLLDGVLREAFANCLQLADGEVDLRSVIVAVYVLLYLLCRRMLSRSEQSF